MDKKHTTPIVTFVVTCHNHPTTMIEETIGSILSLTLSTIERQIVVVDDGSDVSPMNELMPFADNIIYIRMPYGGTGAARNTGIELATGQYLQFVEAGDTLVKAAYEHCLDIVRYKSPDMVMFNHTANAKDSGTIAMTDDRPLSGAEFMRNNSMRGMACGYVFRRDILHNLRFPSDIVHEDEEFTPQLVLRCESLFRVQADAYNRNGQAARSVADKDNRWKLKRLDDTATVIRRLHRRADTLPYEERQAMQRRVAQLTMDYLHDVIVVTRSKHHLNERIESLEREGLFPLPEKAYTKRYLMFSRLMRSSAGRNFLLLTIPLASRKLRN